MTPDDFRKRTKAFALRVIRLVEALPRKRTCEVLGRQLLRSGTGVAANYRAACRAKSRADFVAKMRVVEEEGDESLCWIELLVESGHLKPHLVADLMREGNEVLALVVASIKTARARGAAVEHARRPIPNPQSPIPNLQSPIPNGKGG